MKNENNSMTFLEFKAWLAGFIVAKKGALPDLEDWKRIKQMMDNVEPDVVYVETPGDLYKLPEPYIPNRYIWTSDNTAPYKVSYDGTSTLTTANTKLDVDIAAQLEMAFEKLENLNG